jgi:DNA-binding transcriptional regulator YdaS (Cro superfamily)
MSKELEELDRKAAKGLSDAIEAAGGLNKLARRLRISRQAVLAWKDRCRIPAERLIEIESITGVPRERLRPELYRQTGKK